MDYNCLKYRSVYKANVSRVNETKYYFNIAG